MDTTKWILLSFMLAAINATAQPADTLRLKVYYTFSHVEDTTDRNKPREEQMVLLLGRNMSLYTSMDRIAVEEERLRMFREQAKNATEGSFNFRMTKPSKSYSPADYYQFTGSKRMVISQRMINNYLIEGPLPAISWKITPDTMTISGLLCQKALTSFRGRDYTAWFCADLPFQSGPWKLNGLPGLILEAYDAGREVVFKLNGMEKVKIIPPSSPDVVEDFGAGIKISGVNKLNPVLLATISLPENGIKTTAEDFNKLLRARNADPSGFINAAMSGSGVNVKPAAGAQPSGTPKRSTINNPIERL